MPVKTQTGRSIHASLQRMYELALEDGINGPSALARHINESTQAINNWSRGRGVSNKGAMKVQRLCGWSAAYIMDGRGPKRVSRATLSEVLDLPVSVPENFIATARVKGILNDDALTQWKASNAAHVLVFFSAKVDELIAFQVGPSFQSNNRVRPGEFIVCAHKRAPHSDEDVLVKLHGSWSIKTYIGLSGNRHYWRSLNSESSESAATDEEGIEVSPIVAINPPQSLLAAT